MSAQIKQPSAANEAEPPDASPLLSKILDEMNSLAGKQARISPVRLRSLEEVERYAERAARSGIVPKDYTGKPDAIIVAVMYGAEIGLAPMQSLISIAVINGRPAIWGDAMPGLCRASGICLYIKEWAEGEGEDLTWYCEAKRKDDPTPIRQKFSVTDAKTAKLWGKTGYNGQPTPWITNPGRMLQMRARGFALRDAFPDVLRGLISAEEARDISLSEVIAATEAAPPQPRQRAPASSRREEINHETAYGQPADTGREIGDSIPALDAEAPPLDPNAPVWPLATNQGGKMYGTGSEWIAAWTAKPKGLIARMVAADALDKLRAAAEMNKGCFEQIAEFDPQAVTDVRAAIASALGETEAV